MAETGHGAQGHLPASPHQLTDAGATTLPISAVELQGHLVQPGVAAEITYLPMTRRYLHLVTIMDPRKPYVLASRLSDTLEANSRIDAQRDAVKISMDGKERCAPTIFVKWLWCTGKLEQLYVRAYANSTETRREL